MKHSLEPIPRGIKMIIDELWDWSAHAPIFDLLSVLEAGGFDVSGEREGWDEVFDHIPQNEWAPPLGEAVRRLCFHHTPREAAYELASNMHLMKDGRNVTFSRGRIRRSLRNMFVRAGYALDHKG